MKGNCINVCNEGKELVQIDLDFLSIVITCDKCCVTSKVWRLLILSYTNKYVYQIDFYGLCLDTIQ